MLTEAATIFLLVLSIHYTMQDGEIFGALGSWLERILPEAIHPALFSCNVCMTPWYGSVIYVVLYGVNWQWPVVVISAMGMNAALNKLAPQKHKGCRII